MKRLAAVIGNSTIEDIEQTNNNKLRGMHYDLVQINGASVRDMNRAMRADFREESRPIDILIAAPGVHDLEAGRHSEDIIADLKDTKDMIESWNNENTCGFGKLPYATRLSKIYNETSYHLEDHTPVEECSQEIKKD